MSEETQAADPEVQPEVQPEMPSLIKRVSRFTLAAIQHQIRGNPTCTQEEVDERFAICEQCPRLRTKRGRTFCGHMGCGCNVTKSSNTYMNKLAWADQECPENPPKWLKIDK